MDWIGIIAGLLIGGGATAYYLRSKLNAISSLVENSYTLYGDIRKVIEDYKKARDDGIITDAEIDEIFSQIESMVDVAEEIAHDINVIMKKE